MSNLPIYRRIFRTTFLHSGVRSFFSVGTALLMIFIVRIMRPVEFGKFSLFTQIAVTLGLFLSWGSSGTLAKFLPEQKTELEQKRLSSQAMEVSLISIAVFILLFFIFYFLNPSILPVEIKSAKFLFIFFTSFFALFNVLQGVFRGLGKFVTWSVIEGSNDLTARLMTLAFLLVLGASYKTALYCYLVPLILFTLYSFFATRQQYLFSDLKVDPKVAQLAGVMLIGSLMFMLGTSTDAILLRALLKEPREVG